MDPQVAFDKAVARETLIFFPDGKFHRPDELEDMELNDIQRDKIEAFIGLHEGSCWVGRINLYPFDPVDKPIMKKLKLYEKIYNFDWTFIIPRRDTLLEQMIFDRYQEPYEDTSRDLEMVEEITARIEQLGGHHLHWV